MGNTVRLERKTSTVGFRDAIRRLLGGLNDHTLNPGPASLKQSSLPWQSQDARASTSGIGDFPMNGEPRCKVQRWRAERTWFRT